MRLWNLHPRYLDARGLVALWREALLAQAVLCGDTRGYRNHPQLLRFREHGNPGAAIARYLSVIHAESAGRGYRFDAGRVRSNDDAAPIAVARGQVQYEWEHLLAKLATRDPERHRKWTHLKRPRTHPLFRVVPGGVAAWERPGHDGRGGGGVWHGAASVR